MAYLETHFFSQELGLCCSANVLMPQDFERAQQREIPVLYLLHGHSDDHTIWMRRTAIERHAESLTPGFAVVMPAVDRSFYSDMKHGNRYWRYISNELPRIMSSMFPLSNKREDTFAAGLSMGGYGALKLALNHPDRYLACASLSGACDMGTGLKEAGRDDAFRCQMMDIFGSQEEFRHSVNDLFWQAEKVSKVPVKPQIYMACGTKDFLYQNNLDFLAHLRALDLPVRWEETPGREHTWDYWDEKIQVALRWFSELRTNATRS